MPLPVNTAEGFRWIETPAPGKFSFEVCVESTQLRQTSDFPVLNVTRYDQWAKAPRTMSAANLPGPYVYAMASEEHRPEGFNKFIFAPVIDDTASAVAVYSYKVSKNLSWPAVLSSLILRAIDEVSGFYECVGGSSADLVHYNGSPGLAAVDVVWAKDAYDGLTDFLVEIFIKNAPFTISSTGATKPYPRSLHFDRHIISASLPPHLRPSTQLPRMEITASGVGSASYAGINFGATNQTAWVQHIENDGQVLHPSGLWRRETWTALVPDVS